MKILDEIKSANIAMTKIKEIKTMISKMESYEKQTEEMGYEALVNDIHKRVYGMKQVLRILEGKERHCYICDITDKRISNFCPECGKPLGK